MEICSAIFATTISLVLPLPDDAGGRAGRTKVIAQNRSETAVSCRFQAGSLTIDETIPGDSVKEIAGFRQFAGLVRAACSEAIALFSLVEPSGRESAITERYDAVPLPARSRVLVPIKESSIAIAEVAGKPCPMRLTWRSDGRPVRTDLRDFAAWQLHAIRLENGAESIPGLSLEVRAECEEGRVGVFVPHRDRRPYESRGDAAAISSRSAINSRAATVNSALTVSSFKAAPFEDPATGLVYLRERWYDRNSGTFLTPDPMGYLDSSNAYSFGAGDPVNSTDPTGLALYAFDGTWNDREQMTNVTNVAKLTDLYVSGATAYQKGVGTDWYSKHIGGLTGAGAYGRQRAARDELERNWNGGDQTIDIIGFSRGAATAVWFANRIARYGVWDEKLGTRVFPKIRFLGLFDTVGSFGVPGNKIEMNVEMVLPPNIQHVRHAIARDEYRSAFPLTRMSNPKCQHIDVWEKEFAGAHADVGGGYEDNDMLSRLPLQWMWQQMVAAGIKMKPLRLETGLIPPGSEAVQHVSHNSLIYAEDWVRVRVATLFRQEPRRRIFTTPCYEDWY